MENPEATKKLQAVFPYITNTYYHNGSLYFEGKSKNDRILVSKKNNQWILTINEICFVAATSDGTPDEITDAMMCIADGKPVEPNAHALLVRKLLSK